MLQLRCAAQNYDWGRKYQDSEVRATACQVHGQYAGHSMTGNCEKHAHCVKHSVEYHLLACTQVAKLAHANGNEVDESKPFAELWCVGRWRLGPLFRQST